MLGNVELFRLLLKCVLLWRALPAFLGPLVQISCCIPSSPSLQHPGYGSSHGEGMLISTRAVFWLGWEAAAPCIPPSQLAAITRAGVQRNAGWAAAWGRCLLRFGCRRGSCASLGACSLFWMLNLCQHRARSCLELVLGETSGLGPHQPGFSLVFCQVSQEPVVTSIFLLLCVVWWFGFVAPRE